MTKLITEPASIYVGMKSNLERAFADHLEVQRLAGEVVKWRYESTKFNVGAASSQTGRGAWYTPDFEVIYRDYHKAYYEVKGSWQMKNARDSKAKIKAAAKEYTEYSWVGVTRNKRREWEYERFA